MRVFNELQRFDQWWSRLGAAALLLALSYGCYHWYVLGNAVGNIGPSDHIPQLIAIFAIVLSVLFVQMISLRSQIDERGIRYQFFPFHRSYRKVPWAAISSVTVRTYGPLKEYGGWGYRLSPKNGKAYNIRGTKGIQLHLTDGEKILIGTQKEKVAQAILDRYFKSSNALNL